MEFLRESVREFIDCVLTYEELEAIFDSKNIRLTELLESQIDSGSKYGREFAKSGGVKNAVIRGLSEIGYSDLDCQIIAANGLEECNVTLLKAQKGLLTNTLIEGMACPGGCLGGPCCLRHKENYKKDIEDHGTASTIKNIKDSLMDEELEGV